MSFSKVKFHILTFIFLIVAFFLLPSSKSYALDDWESEYVAEANTGLASILEKKDIMASVYLCDSYDIKAAADENSSNVVSVYSGQLVTILSEDLDDDYNIWVYVHFYFRGTEYTGYVLRSNLAVSDEDFLAWEEDYGMKEEYWNYSPMLYSISFLGIDPLLEGGEEEPDPIEEEEPESPYPEDIMAFPESYRDSLLALKTAHPNWTFVKVSTGLDFQTVINNEILGGKSLVYRTFDDCTKEGAYDNNIWYYASEDILKYYMDPRNALTESGIFQFEQLTYNDSYHTQPALDLFLNTTFMNDSAKAPLMDITYSDIIWNLSKAKGISPFFLASRIYQEQGSGTSALISGSYPGFEGYFNYLNIGASGTTTTDVIVNGLTYARNAGWNNPYKSIDGGSDTISKNYILAGQDTLYFQKFNVSPYTTHAIYSHQYMQNISAPTSEGLTTKKMYANSNSLDCAFVFKIPVYENLPETVCVKPTTTTNVCLTLPSTASVNGVSSTPSVWIDGIEKKSLYRNGHLVIDTETTNATNAVVYKYNSSGVCVGMYVWILNYSNGAYIATYESGLEDLLTYQGFSIRIVGKAGIRFKTGISSSLRETLISSGVDGYSLSEYGTLAMRNANRSTLPFIKNGEKVKSGIAYGTDSSGQHIDQIFETVNGNYRFTSVLVGLPAEEYKTEYAFRGYIILSNGSRSITIYGPPVARSIYYLADKFVNQKTYAEGSSSDLYLRQIISDADALATSDAE